MAYISHILELIIAWILLIISHFGYLGIFAAMALESAALPVPSEVVLPFSGYLASQGQLHLWLVILIATLANLTGATITYWIGYYGGRKVLNNYGKYILINKDEISRMDRWLVKYQSATAFFARLVPGIRTFSSLAVGSARGINFFKFVLYTFMGSLIWNGTLAYVGFVAGDHWNVLHPYFQKANTVIVVLVLAGIAVFIYRHLKHTHND